MQGSDLIEVRGLKLRGRIGVTADERSQDQALVVSIAARLDTRAASTTDDLTATLDYEEVEEVAVEITRSREDLGPQR